MSVRALWMDGPNHAALRDIKRPKIGDDDGLLRVELAGGVYLSNRAFSHMRARHAEEEDADEDAEEEAEECQGRGVQLGGGGGFAQA